MGKVILKRIKVKNIDTDFRKKMYSLFEKYYKNAEYNRFCTYLDEKEFVLTMWSKIKHTKELIGFSSIMRKTCYSPEPYVYIYSGDTVLDKTIWGGKYLQKSFFWFILETKLLALNKPVYWFLISKGHKTYLMMRKNFPNSFPNRSQEIPKRIKAIMDQYYSHKFQNAYSTETNLITCEQNSEATKMEYWDLKKDFQQDPDGEFFFKANPDFSKGVELACIAEIRWGEFYHHIKKFFIKGLQLN